MTTKELRDELIKQKINKRLSQSLSKDLKYRKDLKYVYLMRDVVIRNLNEDIMFSDLSCKIFVCRTSPYNTLFRFHSDMLQFNYTYIYGYR